MIFEKNIFAGTELISIGIVVSLSGLKGELKIHPFFLNATELNELIKFSKELYIEQNSFPKKINYKNSKIQNNHLIFTSKELNSIGDASGLENRKVFVRSSMFTSFLEASNSIVQYLDYQVHDTKLGNLGKIFDFMMGGQNAIVVINEEKKEIIIPFIEPLVIEVDKPNRKIITDLPEGFLE